MTISILLIEDNADDAKLVSHIINKGITDASIQHVDSFEIYQELISKSSFDIILSDYNCQTFTGLDVVMELEERAMDIPIIFITGDHSLDKALTAMKYNVDDYLVKDYECLKKLPSIIKKIIKNKELEKSSEQSSHNISNALSDYINLCETSPELIISLWKDGSFITVNQNILDILKLSKQDLTRLNFKELLNESFHIEFDHIINKLSLVKPKKEVLFDLQSKSNNSITVKGDVTARIENGKVIGSHWVLHDVSEIRKKDDLDIKNNDKYKSVFELSPVPLVMGDQRGIVLQINQAACDLVGYTYEEMIGKHIRTITHPLDLIKSLIYHRRLTTGEIDNYTIKKRYKHKEGFYVETEVTAVLLRNNKGQPCFGIAEITKL